MYQSKLNMVMINVPPWRWQWWVSVTAVVATILLVVPSSLLQVPAAEAASCIGTTSPGGTFTDAVNVFSGCTITGWANFNMAGAAVSTSVALSVLVSGSTIQTGQRLNIGGPTIASAHQPLNATIVDTRFTNSALRISGIFPSGTTITVLRTIFSMTATKLSVGQPTGGGVLYINPSIYFFYSKFRDGSSFILAESTIISDKGASDKYNIALIHSDNPNHLVLENGSTFLFRDSNLVSDSQGVDPLSYLTWNLVLYVTSLVPPPSPSPVAGSPPSSASNVFAFVRTNFTCESVNGACHNRFYIVQSTASPAIIPPPNPYSTADIITTPTLSANSTATFGFLSISGDAVDSEGHSLLVSRLQASGRHVAAAQLVIFYGCRLDSHAYSAGLPLLPTVPTGTFFLLQSSRLSGSRQIAGLGLLQQLLLVEGPHNVTAVVADCAFDASSSVFSREAVRVTGTAWREFRLYLLRNRALTLDYGFATMDAPLAPSGVGGVMGTLEVHLYRNEVSGTLKQPLLVGYAAPERFIVCRNKFYGKLLMTPEAHAIGVTDVPTAALVMAPYCEPRTRTATLVTVGPAPAAATTRTISGRSVSVSSSSRSSPPLLNLSHTLSILSASLSSSVTASPTATGTGTPLAPPATESVTATATAIIINTSTKSTTTATTTQRPLHSPSSFSPSKSTPPPKTPSTTRIRGNHTVTTSSSSTSWEEGTVPNTTTSVDTTTTTTATTTTSADPVTSVNVSTTADTTASSTLTTNSTTSAAGTSDMSTTSAAMTTTAASTTSAPTTPTTTAQPTSTVCGGINTTAASLPPPRTATATAWLSISVEDTTSLENTAAPPADTVAAVNTSVTFTFPAGVLQDAHLIALDQPVEWHITASTATATTANNSGSNTTSSGSSSPSSVIQVDPVLRMGRCVVKGAGAQSQNAIVVCDVSRPLLQAVLAAFPNSPTTLRTVLASSSSSGGGGGSGEGPCNNNSTSTPPPTVMALLLVVSPVTRETQGAASVITVMVLMAATGAVLAAVVDPFAVDAQLVTVVLLSACGEWAESGALLSRYLLSPLVDLGPAVVAITHTAVAVTAAMLHGGAAAVVMAALIRKKKKKKSKNNMHTRDDSTTSKSALWWEACAAVRFPSRSFIVATALYPGAAWGAALCLQRIGGGGVGGADHSNDVVAVVVAVCGLLIPSPVIGAYCLVRVSQAEFIPQFNAPLPSLVSSPSSKQVGKRWRHAGDNTTDGVGATTRGVGRLRHLAQWLLRPLGAWRGGKTLRMVVADAPNLDNTNHTSSLLHAPAATIADGQEGDTLTLHSEEEERRRGGAYTALKTDSLYDQGQDGAEVNNNQNEGTVAELHVEAYAFAGLRGLAGPHAPLLLVPTRLVFLLCCAFVAAPPHSTSCGGRLFGAAAVLALAAVVVAAVRPYRVRLTTVLTVVLYASIALLAVAHGLHSNTSRTPSGSPSSSSSSSSSSSPSTSSSSSTTARDDASGHSSSGVITMANVAIVLASAAAILRAIHAIVIAVIEERTRRRTTMMPRHHPSGRPPPHRQHEYRHKEHEEHEELQQQPQTTDVPMLTVVGSRRHTDHRTSSGGGCRSSGGGSRYAPGRSARSYILDEADD